MRALVVLAVLVGACTAPSQHDAQRYGMITVAFGPALDDAGPWRADQLVELRAELVALNALGPSFVEAPEGSAMLVVRPFNSGPTCARGAARFTPGTTFVEIDPATPCTNGYTELRAAMGHELGHALGMEHVCFTAGELSTCRGIGPAMMNPQLSYGDVLSDTPGEPLGVATDVPTDLDLAEFSRTHH